MGTEDKIITCYKDDGKVSDSSVVLLLEDDDKQ